MLRGFLSLFLLAALGPASHALAKETFEEKSCRIFFAHIVGPTADEIRVLQQVRGNLYKIPVLPPAETDRLNLRLIGRLERLPFPKKVHGRARGTTPEQRRALFDKIMGLPEVQESLCGTYQGSKNLGFCFPRALAVHLATLGSEIDKRSIRKVWAVGNLTARGRSYDFHVTTAVRGDDGKWYAIDPFMGEVAELGDWYRAVRKSVDPTGTARIYSTAASQLHPGSWNIYSSPLLYRRVYHGFFEDVIRTLKQIRSGEQRLE